MYETPDYQLTVPIAGFDPAVKDNQTAHSTDREQGNGDLEYVTHPGVYNS